MEEQCAQPKIFNKYGMVVKPVIDESGKILGARFPFEGEDAVVSVAHGYSNVRQHLADYYYGLLTPEDKELLKQRPRKRRRVGEEQQRVTDVGLVDLAAILAKGFAMGSLPLSSSANPGVAFIVQQLAPFATLPSPSTVTRRFDALYEKTMNVVATEIRDARASDLGPGYVSVSPRICGHQSANEVMLGSICACWTQTSCSATSPLGAIHWHVRIRGNESPRKSLLCWQQLESIRKMWQALPPTVGRRLSMPPRRSALDYVRTFRVQPTC